jgi:hypothetical protein
VPPGGPHRRIDLDAVRAEAHPGRLQTQSFDVRSPPGGHQDRFALDGFDRATGAPEADLADASVLPRGDRFGVREDPHAVLFESPPEERGNVLILARENPGRLLEDGDAHAQAGERLPELAPHGAAADNDHSIRLLVEPVEDRFVGVMRRSPQPLDRRNSGAAARRDHEVPSAKSNAVDLDFTGRDESRLAAKYVDPEPFETLLRIVRSDLRAALPHPPHHGLELEAGLLRIEPPVARAPDLRDQASGRNQGLRRHAAGVEAVPAHPIPFDERNAAPEAGGSRRRHEAGRAGADHDDVVGSASFFPIRRHGSPRESRPPNRPRRIFFRIPGRAPFLKTPAPAASAEWPRRRSRSPSARVRASGSSPTPGRDGRRRD